MDGLLNGQILLVGLYCALALNALTAWVRFARPPEDPDSSGKALSWRLTSAVLQTLALPLVYVIVLLDPHAFSSLLGRAPNAELVRWTCVRAYPLVRCTILHSDQMMVKQQ